MALDSQIPRSGSSRRYMSSSRRRSRRWPWVVLLLVGVILGVWYLSSGGDETAVEDAGDETTIQTAGSDSSSDASADSGPTSLYPSRGAISMNRSGSGTAADNTSNSTSRSPDTSSTNTRNRVPTPPSTSNTSTRVEASTPSFTLGELHNRSDRNTSSSTSGSRSSSSQSSYTPPSDPSISGRLARGRQLIEQGQFVQGRAVLSQLLFDENVNLNAADADRVRQLLSEVNNMLVFARERVPNDPVTSYHEIQPGDSYAKVAPKAKVPHQFLQMVNQTDPTRLQVGQAMKIINGPFHVRVMKSDYLMDVFLRDDQGRPVYVTSFPVGLGEDDSTPPGQWVVTPGRKVRNPSWRNPRTGEFYGADNPENPIGEYWIALSGVDANTANKQGYGIHGTTDPDSIGDQRSMGCIRLRNEDIATLYYMLQEGESTVEVQP